MLPRIASFGRAAAAAETAAREPLIEPLPALRAAPAQAGSYDADLIIVGAGPAGLSAALSAAKESKGRPLRVLVVDKRTEWTRPQIALWTGSSLRKMRKLGVDVSDPAFTKIERAQVTNATGEGEKRSWLPLLLLRTLFRRMAPINRVQDLLEVPVQRGNRSIELRRGVSAEGVVEDANGVSLTLRNPDGTTQRVRAKYLAAADGSRSALRDELGIDRINVSPENPGVIGVVPQTSAPGINSRTVMLDGEKIRIIRQDTPNGTSIAADLPLTAPRDPASVDAHFRRVAELSGVPANWKEDDFLHPPSVFVGQLSKTDKLTQGGRAWVIGDSAHTTVTASGLGGRFAISDGVRFGKMVAKLTEEGRSPLKNRLSQAKYELGTSLNTSIIHHVAKAGSMQKPSFEAMVAATHEPGRKIRAIAPGEPVHRTQVALRSSLPPERVWAELTNSMMDSTQGRLWAHELSRAKLISPRLEKDAEWAVSLRGTPPLFYRFTHVDPARRELAYRLLEGHPFAGGGQLRIDREGTGSVLRWDIEYAHPKSQTLIVNGITALEKNRLAARLRELERAEQTGAA